MEMPLNSVEKQTQKQQEQQQSEKSLDNCYFLFNKHDTVRKRQKV